MRKVFQPLAGLLLLVQAIAAGAAEDRSIELPDGRSLDHVVFDRHVVPLLSRYGCNTGACHGSFQGRGGMQLSLFGHSPRKDFDALSARIDFDDPPASLMLLKPTGAEEHGGGVRFERDSWPYQLIKRWIEQGGERDSVAEETVTVVVEPAEILFSSPGESVQLRVRAEFSDDEPPEDLTPFCRFTSGDPGIVIVDERGRVASVRPGASHISVEYLGNFATARTTAPYSGPSVTADTAQAASIDALVSAQLKRLNLAASPPADDYTYLRRVTLDVIGRLPTVDEIRQFTGSDYPDRRERLIDRLLQDDRHAALWATRFCDMTRCTASLMEGPDDLKPKRARMWHDWFRLRVKRNESYVAIVRGFLCATSVGQSDFDDWVDSEATLVRAAKQGFETDYAGRDGCDLFWRRVAADGMYPRQELAEVTAAALLGTRIQCAQCHKHPYDRWTQADYRSFVNIFVGVQFGSSTELNRTVLARLDQRRRDALTGTAGEPLPRLQQVYYSPALARPLPDPETDVPLPPRPLGGPQFDSATDPREQFMSWLVGDGRRQFAVAFVNRAWAHYFGRGIVEPIDDFSAINPPSHPELLQALADNFIETGYDIRRLERTILRSAAYQRSWKPCGNNASDDRHYARAYVRPLLAEVAIDVVHQALGAPVDFGSDLPPSSLAIEIATDRPAEPRTAEMLRNFGRGERKSTCDCDRREGPSLRQTLFLMSDEHLLAAIREGQLRRDLTQDSSREQAVERMFLAILSRKPTPEEQQAAVESLAAAECEKEAWADLVWALVNTREFLTNH